jgi:signal transduction histidine kinase
MEERLQEATESLERSRRQAMIAELAGAAAHELNQPLTSLLGYAELLNRRIEEHDDNFRAAKTIHDEAQRIADIVRKIGRITEYRTKEYVGNARIVDLDGASEVEVDEPGLVESHTETMDEEP